MEIPASLPAAHADAGLCMKRGIAIVNEWVEFVQGISTHDLQNEKF
jgi:hypothetical protein